MARRVGFYSVLLIGIGLCPLSIRSSLAATPASGAAQGPSDAELAAPLDQTTVVRAAIARSPAIRVSRERARAMVSEAKAEGSLPPPEVMAQVWQVPIAAHALDTQMIMVGVSQNFPAPGARGAREEAKGAEAKAEEAMSTDRARQIGTGGRPCVRRLPSSRPPATGSIEPTGRIASTSSMSPRLDTWQGIAGRRDEGPSRVVADGSGRRDGCDARRSARAHINALLGREPGAPLGEPLEREPQLPSWDTQTLLAKAHETRPELRVAKAERDARQLTLRAAEREATWPSFTLGALYFPRRRPIRYHGYGASASVSVPWLWGGARERRTAEEQHLHAAGTNIDAARIPIDTEVVTAETNAESSAYRLQVLRDRRYPRAGERSRSPKQGTRAEESTCSWCSTHVAPWSTSNTTLSWRGPLWTTRSRISTPPWALRYRPSRSRRSMPGRRVPEETMSIEQEDVSDVQRRSRGKPT